MHVIPPWKVIFGLVDIIAFFSTRAKTIKTGGGFSGVRPLSHYSLFTKKAFS